MSVRKGAGASGKSQEPAAQKPSKAATGSRRFVRRTSATQRRTARKQAARRRTQAHMHGLSLTQMTRKVLAGVPTAAWVCALLAFVNAACWSVITPPFQSPDEPDHFAYVQLLAETSKLPSSGLEGYSEEENYVLFDLHQSLIRFRPEGHTISSRAQFAVLQHDLAASLSRRGNGGTGLASSEPPLYYALETIPYALGSSGSLLDRLELMRPVERADGGANRPLRVSLLA